MEGTHGAHLLQTPPQQYPTTPLQKLSKISCFASGIIFLLGGLAATWLLYPQLGNLALSCLSTTPIGIALITVGIYCFNPLKTTRAPNELPWMYYVKGKKIDQVLPMNSQVERLRTEKMLRKLNQNNLSIVGKHLGLERICLLENSQLQHLPWDNLLKDINLLSGIFPIETEEECKLAETRFLSLDVELQSDLVRYSEASKELKEFFNSILSKMSNLDCLVESKK